jgi:hypothetical protein
VLLALMLLPPSLLMLLPPRSLLLLLLPPRSLLLLLLLVLLLPDKRQLYEFVVRHFLASCSKDAVAFETTVTIDIAGEAFRTTGASANACILYRQAVQFWCNWPLQE